MPTWSELLAEISQITTASAFDIVRRKYLKQLTEHTHRSAVLYASSWTQPKGQISPELLSIADEDIEAFMEVLHGLDGNEIDLIVHSPGGTAEATGALVKYLRTRFTDVRVIVPHAAMSAATMLSCSANRIVMGKHSFIGPIDPQFVLPYQGSAMSWPAQAIIDQFEKAKEEIKHDPDSIGVWMPIISQYGPALIQDASDQLELSKSLVSEWLTTYMFGDDQDAKIKASKISAWLSDHHEFKSHGIYIDRENARNHGMKIDNLEDDQTLQDLVLSVYHSAMITFTYTTAVKIVENNMGKSFIKTALPSQPNVTAPPSNDLHQL